VASAAHQWLLVWASRRMEADGFAVAGFDGRARQGGRWNAMPAPFALAGMRPDAWGLREDDALLAFAEAKTADDIDNAHTRKQLAAFARARIGAGDDCPRCPLYIAIPRSAVHLLDRVLARLGLTGASNIIRIHVPDILLEDGEAP
jgi:hypothetical protein